MPQTKDRSPKTPTFLETARAFYADAFEHRRKKDLAAAMDEWSHLHEAEQSFAVAHLMFLNLKAQAETLRVLTDLRDLLDEVADSVDEVFSNEGERDDGPSDEDPNQADDPAASDANEPAASTDTDPARGAA